MMFDLAKHRARLAFEVAILSGTELPRRGMVFRYPNGEIPTHITCRADLGEGNWADPEMPGETPTIINVPAQLREKAIGFDGVDPAYTDTPDDIVQFGVSQHADLAVLAKRIKETDETVRWQKDLLYSPPEVVFDKYGISFAGRLIGHFAAACEELLLREPRAKNFLQFCFTSPKEPARKMFLTVRRATGKTVEEAWFERGRAIDKIVAEYKKAGALEAAGLRRALELLGVDPNVESTLAAELAKNAAEEDEPISRDPNVAHLSVDTITNEFVCAACGVREKLSVPVTTDRMLELLTSFTEKHRTCPDDPVLRAIRGAPIGPPLSTMELAAVEEAEAEQRAGAPTYSTGEIALILKHRRATEGEALEPGGHPTDALEDARNLSELRERIVAECQQRGLTEDQLLALIEAKRAAYNEAKRRLADMAAGREDPLPVEQVFAEAKAKHGVAS